MNGPDMHGPDMHGPDMHGPDTSGPDMHGPDMHGPDMHGPDMHGPDMHGPDTSGPADDRTVRALQDRAARAVPPMALDAAAVLAAGRRGRRRRAVAQVTLVAVGTAAVVVGVQLGLPRWQPTPPAATDPATQPAPHPTGSPGPVLSGRYLCRGTPVPLDVLDAGRPATSLDPARLAALASMDINAGPDWASWTVLEDSGSTVVLIRPAASEDHGGGAYEVYGIELVPPGGGAAPVNDTSAPAWSVTMWSACDVRAELPGLHNVSLSLDPDHPLEPNATRVTVLVHEEECTGGSDPTERVEVVAVTPTPTSVELVVGTRPLAGGAFTCPGNPAVPITIELDEPLGDRVLVDASAYPKRELTLSPG